MPSNYHNNDSAAYCHPVNSGEPKEKAFDPVRGADARGSPKVSPKKTSPTESHRNIQSTCEHWAKAMRIPISFVLRATE